MQACSSSKFSCNNTYFAAAANSGFEGSASAPERNTSAMATAMALDSEQSLESLALQRAAEITELVVNGRGEVRAQAVNELLELYDANSRWDVSQLYHLR